MLKNQKKSEQGFSIVEVVIATGIVALAFVGMMALFAYNIRTEITSRNKLVATYLAQEGMEAVRYQRSKNWAADKNTAPACWDGLLTPTSSKILRLSTPGTMTSGTDWNFIDASPTNTAVYIHRTTGVYDQNTGGDLQRTLFTRVIKMQRVGTDGLKVNVIVGYGAGKEINLESYLYNW